jgi:hypothetical protein
MSFRLTTLTSTLIIVLYILNLREEATGKITKSRPHTAMEIVVESSALYAVTAILWVPFQVDSNFTTGDSDQLR